MTNISTPLYFATPVTTSDVLLSPHNLGSPYQSLDGCWQGNVYPFHQVSVDNPVYHQRESPGSSWSILSIHQGKHGGVFGPNVADTMIPKASQGNSQFLGWSRAWILTEDLMSIPYTGPHENWLFEVRLHSRSTTFGRIAKGQIRLFLA